LTFTNVHLKKKKIETHLAYEDGDFDYDMDPTHLDVADFLVDPEGKSDHIINGDGNIKNYISLIISFVVLSVF
jgi:hypothetical protein